MNPKQRKIRTLTLVFRLKQSEKLITVKLNTDTLPVLQPLTCLVYAQFLGQPEIDIDRGADLPIHLRHSTTFASSSTWL